MGVAPKYLRDAIRPLPHPFVLCAPLTGGSSLSLGLGQPWPCLDLFALLALLFGIAFHLHLVLLSYHPIFLCPYHFLKLVSFLGANRTKSASVCPWLLRGAIQILKYNTITSTRRVLNENGKYICYASIEAGLTKIIVQLNRSSVDYTNSLCKKKLEWRK